MTDKWYFLGLLWLGGLGSALLIFTGLWWIYPPIAVIVAGIVTGYYVADAERPKRHKVTVKCDLDFACLCQQCQGYHDN